LFQKKRFRGMRQPTQINGVRSTLIFNKWGQININFLWFKET
jgi:hypothetical protein